MPRNHPRIEDAAVGTLPEWSHVSRSRKAHMRRVADLMAEWAAELGLKKSQCRRWEAAGFLHDALKGARARDMKRLLRSDIATLPVPVLHGPAAAARLRNEGVDDRALLNAIAFHTLGHPALDDIGKALYCADFLEPARTIKKKKRAAWRARMPFELEAVTREVLGARIRHMTQRGRMIRPETIGFWNRLNGGPAWDRVSAEF